MTTGRPRRSRAGLLLVLLLMALALLELTGRFAGVPRVTPLRLAAAAWEVASRGPAPGEAEMARLAYRPLPYVNYGLKPGWERERKTPQTPVRTTNSFGWRGREVERPKPAGRYRIVCLGGSTTYDDSVSDHETYPVRLEEALRAARPGRDIEVVNCGVPSYTTAETLASLAFLVLDLQPDALVLYEGINDLRPRIYLNYEPSYFHFRKVWDGGADSFREGEGDVGGINAFIQHPHPDPNGDAQENTRRNGPGAFRRNLTSIAGIAAAHGVRVAMVGNVFNPERNPYVAEEDARAYAENIRETNAVLREVCAATGALYVDLPAAWPGPQDAPGPLFADLVHNTPAGSALKARVVADALLAGLLP